MASTLGTGFFQPQARPGGVTITQQSLADEIAPFMKDYLERESALASLRSEGLRDEEGELVLDDAGQPIDPGGYKAYTGQTIAEFTPEQLAAQSGLTSLAGFETTIDPVTGERTIERTGPGLSGTRFQDAEALIRGQSEEFTGDVAERFMSPFQQAVIDIEKREAQQKFEQEVLPKLQAAQIQAGSFGGSRGAILEAEAMRSQQQLLGDIQAKGLQSAYNTGLKAFEQQKARERGEATALMGLSPAQLGQQTRELQGLEKVGAVQQQQTQSALDELYKEFLEEQAFPEQVLDRMQGAAFGFPNLRQEVKQSPTTFGPSPFQNLATNVGAIGTGVGNLFGQLGGKTARQHGGVVSRREGGLVPLMRRQNGRQAFQPGDVDDPDGLVDKLNIEKLLEQRDGVTNVYKYMPKSRKERDDLIRQATEMQRSNIRNRIGRSQKATQAARDLYRAQQDPFDLGFNTTALFRMLGAAGRGDPEGAQLGAIGEEAQVIQKERFAADKAMREKEALLKEELLRQEEDIESADLLQKAQRADADSKADFEMAYKIRTLALEESKNANALEAKRFKQVLEARKMPGHIIKELGQTALNRAGLAAIYDSEGKLQSTTQGSTLSATDVKAAEASLGKIYSIYNTALRLSGGDQNYALMIVKEMESMPSSKQPTENAEIDQPAGAVTSTNAPAPVSNLPPVKPVAATTVAPK